MSFIFEVFMRNYLLLTIGLVSVSLHSCESFKVWWETRKLMGQIFVIGFKHGAYEEALKGCKDVSDRERYSEAYKKNIAQLWLTYTHVALGVYAKGSVPNYISYNDLLDVAFESPENIYHFLKTTDVPRAKRDEYVGCLFEKGVKGAALLSKNNLPEACNKLQRDFLEAVKAAVKEI